MQRQKNDNKSLGPLVSVILTVYNEPPEYIRQSLGSLLKQTYQNMEILVLDDSTVQESRNTVDSFCHDRRVHVIRRKDRMGFTHALNIGLERAEGQYIARMDSDDIAMPDRIEKQVAYMEEHEDVAVLGGQIRIISEKGEIVSHRRYPLKGVGFYVYSLIRDPLAHPTVMMRRKLIDAGFRYDESFTCAEDIELWLRILNNHYKIRNLPDILLHYRIDASFNQRRCDKVTRDLMVLARTKNLSIKRPVFSLLSLIFIFVRRNVPVGIINHVYNKENGKVHCG